MGVPQILKLIGDSVKKRIIISIITIVVMLIILYILQIIPHKKYDNSYFGIEQYISNVDKDNDNIDDQTDILLNVKNYVRKRPKYKSKYYDTGYPNDEYGVCTDVVAFGLKNAGYDLMELVNNDIIKNKEKYDIDVVDKNIDFRRVINLNVYFKNNNISLTTDLSKIEEWQGGDIVVFKGHIGIVSDKRNKKGTPYLYHHSNPFQINYEEDVLELYEKQKSIIGHYRIS